MTHRWLVHFAKIAIKVHEAISPARKGKVRSNLPGGNFEMPLLLDITFLDLQTCIV